MIETLDKPREIGSDAFKIEYSKNIPDRVLIDDVVSYLGEYRFNLQKYSYSFSYKNGKLRDPHRGDSMEDLSQRAIDRKTTQWKSPLREQAEKSGFQKLDRQLQQAKTGDSIVWLSPMGAKEEGYGDYGFVFVGKVNGDASEKRISMTAIRIENPTIDQFNRINEEVGQEKTTFQKAEDFLANPKVVKNLPEKSIDSILKKVFEFKPNEKVQKMFDYIIDKMKPIISDLADLLINPWKTKEEKMRGLHSVENYAIKLQADYESFGNENVIYIKGHDNNLRVMDIVREYGHEPPKVAGSCGSTSGKDGFSTSNIFGKASGLNSVLSEQEWFNCPKCEYKADGPVGNQCPGCGLTKEAYAKETGITCE